MKELDRLNLNINKILNCSFHNKPLDLESSILAQKVQLSPQLAQ